MANWSVETYHIHLCIPIYNIYEDDWSHPLETDLYSSLESEVGDQLWPSFKTEVKNKVWKFNKVVFSKSGVFSPLKGGVTTSMNEVTEGLAGPIQ